MSSRKVVDLRQRRPGSHLKYPTSAERSASRPPSLRARRRRARLIALGVFLFICGLAAYAVHRVSYSSQYSIGEIQIQGVGELSSDDIRAAVERELDAGTGAFISPRNIFAYDSGKIIRSLADSFPRIASATLLRPSLFSTTLVVKVTERDPYALWCSDVEQCFLLDESGFIFAAGATATSADVATSTPSTLVATAYLFKGGIATSSAPMGQYVVRAQFAGIIALLKLLGQAGFSPQSVRIENDSDMSVALAQGYLIRASFGQDAPSIVRDLELILSSDALADKTDKLDYVDLRFGGRVYYKLKGEGENQATASSTTR